MVAGHPSRPVRVKGPATAAFQETCGTFERHQIRIGKSTESFHSSWMLSFFDMGSIFGRVRAVQLFTLFLDRFPEEDKHAFTGATLALSSFLALLFTLRYF